MAVAIRKWKAVFGIYFQDGLAYRASGLIWILTDLVTAITMPLVWAKASTTTGVIGGFTQGDFVLYYLCQLLIGSFITSHIMWEVAMEIREGQFSTQLVRPISFYQFTFLRNLSWRIIRTALFAPFFVALLWLYRSYLSDATVYLGWEFWTSFVLGHLVSFTLVTMMAMIALFTTEVMSIFELYYVPMLFLSGQLFPVLLHHRCPDGDTGREDRRAGIIARDRYAGPLDSGCLSRRKGPVGKGTQVLHRRGNVTIAAQI